MQTHSEKGRVIHQAAQRGASLVSVLVAAAIMGILALIVSTLIVNGMQGQKSIELRGEVNLLKQFLADKLDCDHTLREALGDAKFEQFKKDPAVIKPLCDSGKQIRLFGRSSITGEKVALTTKNRRIGTWTIDATCDFAGETLKIGVKGHADPLTGKKLDHNVNQKMILYGPAPQNIPICFGQGSAQSGILGYKYGQIRSDTVQASNKVSAEEFAFEAPAGTAIVELTSNGVFGGNGDSDVDTITANMIINLKDNVYSGSQTTSIGSYNYKKRSVYWEDISIGTFASDQAANSISSYKHYKGFTNLIDQNDNKAYGNGDRDWQAKKFAEPRVRFEGSACKPGKACRLIYGTRILFAPNNAYKRWWTETVQVKFFAGK
jgi:hypothetical protein